MSQITDILSTITWQPPDRYSRQSLTKENFLDALTAACPLAMKEFCKWIDEYKKRNDWNYLIQPKGWINEAGEPIKDKRDRKDGKIGWTTEKKKFHHLPLAMQIGIMLEYMGHPDREWTNHINDWGAVDEEKIVKCFVRRIEQQEISMKEDQ